MRLSSPQVETLISHIQTILMPGRVITAITDTLHKNIARNKNSMWVNDDTRSPKSLIFEHLQSFSWVLQNYSVHLKKSLAIFKSLQKSSDIQCSCVVLENHGTPRIKIARLWNRFRVGRYNLEQSALNGSRVHFSFNFMYVSGFCVFLYIQFWGLMTSAKQSCYFCFTHDPDWWITAVKCDGKDTVFISNPLFSLLDSLHNQAFQKGINFTCW